MWGQASQIQPLVEGEEGARGLSIISTGHYRHSGQDQRCLADSWSYPPSFGGTPCKGFLSPSAGVRSCRGEARGRDSKVGGRLGGPCAAPRPSRVQWFWPFLKNAKSSCIFGYESKTKMLLNGYYFQSLFYRWFLFQIFVYKKLKSPSKSELVFSRIRLILVSVVQNFMPIPDQKDAGKVKV
jgi:hypothetical protein